MDGFWKVVRIGTWIVATAVLAAPYFAMRAGAPGVDWSALDFVVMGVLLYGACAAFEIGARMNGRFAYRLGVGLAVATAFFTTWINLAVGIIGSENEAVNLVFFGVLAIGLAGALLSRFEPRGMALAMAATAAVQAAVIAVAIYYRSMEAVILSGLFAAAWAVSARLFASVAREGEARA